MMNLLSASCALETDNDNKFASNITNITHNSSNRALNALTVLALTLHHISIQD